MKLQNALLAATLLADGKYGAFSPSAATVRPLLDANSPHEVVKRIVGEQSAVLEKCATTLDKKAPRWRFDALGGTVNVVLDVNDTGQATKDVRIARPERGNAKANDCLVTTIRQLSFGANIWPHPLNLVAVIDIDCHVQELDNDFLDVNCNGKFRGVYTAENPKK